MEWWQSLLLAIIPAVIAAIIATITSIVIANKQIKQAKEEINLKYKSENKLYISKTRFDLEISVYKELSEKFLEMVNKVVVLFPKGLYHESHIFEERMQKREKDRISAVHSLIEAHNSLMKLSPFIPENFCLEYESLLDLCVKQINLFPEFRLNNQPIEKELLEEERNCWKRTDTIIEQSKELTKKLRNRIETIDVSENKE